MLLPRRVFRVLRYIHRQVMAFGVCDGSWKSLAVLGLVKLTIFGLSVAGLWQDFGPDRVRAHTGSGRVSLARCAPCVALRELHPASPRRAGSRPCNMRCAHATYGACDSCVAFVCWATGVYHVTCSDVRAIARLARYAQHVHAPALFCSTLCTAPVVIHAGG
jgi:hypothetical protein